MVGMVYPPHPILLSSPSFFAHRRTWALVPSLNHLGPIQDLPICIGTLLALIRMSGEGSSTKSSTDSSITFCILWNPEDLKRIHRLCHRLSRKKKKKLRSDLQQFAGSSIKHITWVYRCKFTYVRVPRVHCQLPVSEKRLRIVTVVAYYIFLRSWGRPAPSE